MKKSVLIIILLLSTFLNAQNESDKTDKMLDEMCSNFKLNENLSDTLRIEILNKKFIHPYLSQFSGSELEDKIDNLYFRFQKRCEHFRDYLVKVDPPKDDNWARLDAHPKITVSENEIAQFKKTIDFYYFEYEGKKTTLKTDKNFWIETFEDGTNSKLYYKWIGKNKFELEFIESNNNGRKNFSKKGDKYIYEIINKENNYYWILSEIPGQSEILKFKLFVGN
ncbi:hypothetical protein [Chryseobacterium shigense]|uniref:Uncharacterized protein n=1 Tax=Chryseobacterium shigense TaxID=297244 RepID=A0A841NBR4_9FLAO|nr:hypothetical protein [Chryseobacterium shigense]MBB6372121.1 hypothetical protein [Chryseobacterium shigense]